MEQLLGNSKMLPSFELTLLPRDLVSVQLWHGNCKSR